MKSLQL